MTDDKERDLLRDTAEVLVEITQHKGEPEAQVLFWLLDGFVSAWKEDGKRQTQRVLPFKLGDDHG